jgi:hypothetical protein
MRKLQWLGVFFLAALMLTLPSQSSAQIAVGVGISVHVGPPALPVYPQPICPGPGYLWTPGYWAYGDAGYYWVPGTWVVAPVGMLWTPGYWGWGGGVYAWHAGYWGPHVGFYGGINYGFGYGGVGFVGGRWNGGVFAYNTAVMHVDTTVIHTTYVDRTVVHVNESRVAFNGGEGGVRAEPNAEERSYEHEHHVEATREQMEHQHAASTNRALLASENHGRPSIAATGRAGDFKGHGVVAASASSHAGGNADRPPNARANHAENKTATNNRSDRPPSAQSAHTTNATQKSATASHASSGNSNAAKSTAHSENKPPSKPQSKPKESGNKPHK